MEGSFEFGDECRSLIMTKRFFISILILFVSLLLSQQIFCFEFCVNGVSFLFKWRHLFFSVEGT